MWTRINLMPNTISNTRCLEYFYLKYTTSLFTSHNFIIQGARKFLRDEWHKTKQQKIKAICI